MSSSFSANQYNGAFKSQKLQNWTIPKHFKERPSAADGHTTFITTDRGHLLPGMKAKSGNAWTSFVGTWDLPNRIPPAYINPTARSQEGQERLKNWSSCRVNAKKASRPKAQSTSPGQEVEASKTQEKLQTDPAMNQEQLLDITPAPCTSPPPPESQKTPEPDQPPNPQSPAPSLTCAANGQPAS